MPWTTFRAAIGFGKGLRRGVVTDCSGVFPNLRGTVITAALQQS